MTAKPLSSKKNSRDITTGKRSEIRNLFVRALLFYAFFAFIIAFLFPIGNRAFAAVSLTIVMACTLAHKLVQICSPRKLIWIKRSLRALSRCYKRLERHQQLYVNVCLFVPFLIYTYIVDTENAFRPLAILFILFVMGVAVFDSVRVYKYLISTVLGKAIIAIGLAAGSNLAFALSGWVIGEMTKVAPINFPHTLSFLSIAMIPLIFIIIGALYVPVAILISPFVLFLSEFQQHAPRLVQFLFATKFVRPQKKYVFFTFIFQVCFYSFVAASFPKLATALAKYDDQIDSLIAKSIFVFDMYPVFECGTLPGYRATATGDENFVLANKVNGNVVFYKNRKCIAEVK